MKYIKTKILLFLFFVPLIIFGQETESDCSEPIIIEMYNLRMAIIKKQKLDSWPSIVQIKKLTELNRQRRDSLILFIVEANNGEKLRLSNSSDLARFVEIDYNDDCRQDGTILTDLEFGKINLMEMKAEVLCRENKFTEFKL